jgi:hypothetical protein
LTGISVYGPEAPKQSNWKVLRGYSKCVHPDTLIIKDGFPFRIGDLPFGAEDTFLPVSGNVQGACGEVPLLDSYNGGVKPLYHVVTRRGIVTCSDQHRFVVADGSLKSISSGLQPGDVIQEAENPEIPDNGYAPIQIKLHKDVPALWYTPTHAMSYFAGAYLGDGCKEGFRSISIAHGTVRKIDRLGIPYKQWQQILIGCCQQVDLAPVPRDHSIYLGSQNAINFMRNLNLFDAQEHRNLRVPPWVLSAGKTACLHYLAGLWDTDGYVNVKDGCGTWTTKDITFASQVCALASLLGLHPRIESSWNKKYLKYYWRVHLSSGGMYQLGAYMKHPGKTARVKTPKQKPTYTINLVQKIIPAGEHFCVDIHVGAEDHLFWCNGLTTRNSTNFALCYGGGGSAVCRALKNEVDKNEGWRIKRQFDQTYFGLSSWWKLQHAFAQKHAFVRTAFGRKYPLPDIRSEDKMFVEKAKRNAVNGPVQGCLNFNSKIPTNYGYLEIQDLLDKDNLLVWTGKAWAPAKAWYSGLKKHMKTTLSSGRFIETSPDHKFLICKENDLVWVAQKDLKKGDLVATDAQTPDHYNYEQIVLFEDLHTESPMYDIEVFDDTHAFVCDGVIVHNSSADITKAAMALIYKECKKRGWLDKVQMIATMHDELVFEIDGEVLEEALLMINTIMTRNTFIMTQKWPIPLTTDTEIGYDWSVPWDINAMRHGECRFLGNKKIKDKDKIPEGYTWDSLPKWPDDLKPFIKVIGGESITIEAPPTPVVVSSTEEKPQAIEENPQTQLSVVEQTQAVSEPVAVAIMETTQYMQNSKSTDSWEFQLNQALKAETLVNLSQVITLSKGSGTRVLLLKTKNGVTLTDWSDNPVTVNPLTFLAYAQVYGLA